MRITPVDTGIALSNEAYMFNSMETIAPARQYVARVS